jgi:Flavin-binding monooxygenase-like
MVFVRAGGYYIGNVSFTGTFLFTIEIDTFLLNSKDVGTSQHIIDGHIKVKSGTSISEFTERGLKFADGSELEADVVVFATGLVKIFPLFRYLF